MIREVIVRSEAKRDLFEAKSWYQTISPELEHDFIRRVDDAIELARERPMAFQVVHRTFRRVLIRRFPYALFYHVVEARVVVVAVLHQARDPESVKRRRR